MLDIYPSLCGDTWSATNYGDMIFNVKLYSPQLLAKQVRLDNIHQNSRFIGTRNMHQALSLTSPLANELGAG